MNLINTIRRITSILAMFFGFSILMWGIITAIKEFTGLNEAIMLVVIGTGLVIFGALISRGKLRNTLWNFLGRKIR